MKICSSDVTRRMTTWHLHHLHHFSWRRLIAFVCGGIDLAHVRFPWVVSSIDLKLITDRQKVLAWPVRVRTKEHTVSLKSLTPDLCSHQKSNRFYSGPVIFSNVSLTRHLRCLKSIRWWLCKETHCASRTLRLGVVVLNSLLTGLFPISCTSCCLAHIWLAASPHAWPQLRGRGLHGSVEAPDPYGCYCPSLLKPRRLSHLSMAAGRCLGFTLNSKYQQGLIH